MRFGIFELDEANAQLRRAGVLIKLTPRQFRLLHLLVRNPGQVITREAIQKEIWDADTFVDFQRNLNVCVAQLRAAIGDDSEAPRFIETVPRRGYRFVAPVTLLPAAAGEAPAIPAASYGPMRRTRKTAAWVVALACCLLAVLLALRSKPSPAPIRLAVLPFENVESNAANDPVIRPFLDGLTGELISTLGAQNARLGVIGRASVMRFKGSAPDLARLAKELRADYVVEGTLRRQQDRMRLTASLVRVADQMQVWTETFERDAANSFELQEDLSARVAAGVLRSLVPEAAPTSRPHGSVGEAAYQAYLNGRYLQRQGTRDGLERSVAFFQDAARQAPEFASAQAALAETYVAMARSGSAAPDVFAKARSAAESALGVDPGNAEAHNALANVLFWHEWNWTAAGRQFDAAIEDNPSFALAHHDRAFFLVAVGRREAGLTALRKALAIDPLSVRVNIDAGWLYLQARHFEEAIAQARRARELEPGLKEADACIARARLYQGRPATSPGNSRALDDPFLRAAFAAIEGENDRVFPALEQAYASHRPMMVFLNTEPSFDKIREDPRFRALLERMNLPAR